MLLPGFIGESYTSQSLVAAGQQTMNLYPERIEVEDKVRMTLYPTPGMVSFATVIHAL